MDKSILLAQLWVRLDKLHMEISHEVIPAILHMRGASPEGQELAQTLELAAQHVRDYLEGLRLVAEPRKPGAK